MYKVVNKSIDEMKVNAVFTALFSYYNGNLCLLTVKEKWGVDKGKIGLPGGKTDGQTATEAAIREWREELGNTIERPNIKYEPIFFEDIGKAVIFVGFVNNPPIIREFKKNDSKDGEIDTVRWTPVYKLFMALDGLTSWKVRPFMTILIQDITSVLNMKFKTSVNKIYYNYLLDRIHLLKNRRLEILF